MNDDIFADDMFAVSDEEHHDISPTFAPPGQRSASPALQADASTLKQKANHEADASVESYKRLRPTGPAHSRNVVLRSLNWPQADVYTVVQTLYRPLRTSASIWKSTWYTILKLKLLLPRTKALV